MKTYPSKKLQWKFERILNDNFSIISANLDKSQLDLIPLNNLLKDESLMLENLDIKSTIRTRKKVNLIDGALSVQQELTISAKKFSTIGFCLTRKQKKLEKILN